MQTSMIDTRIQNESKYEVYEVKQVKPGFTTYQPQLKDFMAWSKIEETATKTIKPTDSLNKS